MNIQDIVNELGKLLSFSTTKSPNVPTPLRLAANNRPGLSALKITNNILKDKQELGLPTGTLDDGTQNIDDIMISIIVKRIVEAIQQDSRVEIAVNIGGNVISTGVGADGVPVTTTGAVVSIQGGTGVIQ